MTARRPSPKHKTPKKIEFDTFDLSPLTYGKYRFLLDMPKGAHFHFAPGNEIQLRNCINEMNRRLAQKGAKVHFSCRKVGGDDPKGPGYRVLRDDRPIRGATS